MKILSIASPAASWYWRRERFNRWLMRNVCHQLHSSKAKPLRCGALIYHYRLLRHDGGCRPILSGECLKACLILPKSNSSQWKYRLRIVKSISCLIFEWKPLKWRVIHVIEATRPHDLITMLIFKMASWAKAGVSLGPVLCRQDCTHFDFGLMPRLRID